MNNLMEQFENLISMCYRLKNSQTTNDAADRNINENVKSQFQITLARAAKLQNLIPVSVDRLMCACGWGVSEFAGHQNAR